MKKYDLKILSAAFVASGAAIQAKGYLYRMKPDKGRKTEGEDYGLDALPAMTQPSDTHGAAGERIDMSETEWTGEGDYWLGRTVLTDMVVNVPDMGLLHIPDVAINVSLQKEIVKTALVGRKGTIKEYITQGDYQITMSVGVAAINDRNELIDQYPEQAMSMLRKVLETDTALEVGSAFLDIFEISRIVVTNFSVKQMTYANRQVVEITALSDSDYVIESTDY